jgi:tetratricopeptide (TPR) repeat protein
MPLIPAYRLSWTYWIAGLLLCPAVCVSAQSKPCPAAPERAGNPADSAYSDGNYPGAEEMYAKALAEKPQDAELSAALVRTLLHEGKAAEATTQANSNLAANPHSAAALTAMAEVQLRQGQPWLAMQSLDAAKDVNPCFARSHLIRSRALRIDSMYVSERAEIQRAYEIDPNDPDIQSAWRGIVEPAQEVQSVTDALATTKDIEPEIRKKAEETAHSMLPLLSENSQTCQVLPTVASATLPLLAVMPDPKHIEGYRLQAQLPQSEAKLILDSAASGLYISRALADANGLKHDPNAPEGTVHLDSVRIGPLEFRDCLVGVSDAPFAGKADGFIGTDVFASYLITLDFRLAKMTLDPLPPQAGVLPGDRPTAPELAGFVPVYHRRHYLLLPIGFNNKSRKLFALATGMQESAMSAEAAHSVSNITVNFTNTEQTVSGTRVQFFREIFDLQLASLPTVHQGHVLQIDPATMNHNAGFQIAGMLGLDVLHSMTVHLDYRDGMVKLETADKEFSPGLKGRNLNASAQGADQSECPHVDDQDHPIGSTVEVSVMGTLDAGHLKPGKEIWVKAVTGWEHPECRIEKGAVIYGHVTAAVSTKSPDSSELSLSFDHADCTGHSKQAVSLQLIGLVGPPDESKNMHDALPTQVAGGGRQIQDAVSASNGVDDNLNPGGRPNTVHPGVVIRMPKVKLEPEAGPGCSARISSTSHSLQLAPGAELILLMRSMPK